MWLFDEDISYVLKLKEEELYMSFPSNKLYTDESSQRKIELMSGSVDDPRLEQSIERKRRWTLSAPSKFDEDFEPTHLFEHFMILGIPPDADLKKEVKPRILFLFPSAPLVFSEDDFNQTVDFCFPNGIEPHGRKYKRKNIFISEFVFRLDSKSIYGVCCHFVINPSRIPFFASEETIQYPYCFCILTRDPILSVHFQYLTYMALLYCRVLNPEGERNVKFHETPEGLTLSYLEEEKGTARWPGTRYPDVLHTELEFFFSMKRSEDRDIKYVLSEDIRLVIPPFNSEIVTIALPTLDVLFSCLSVTNITKLFVALLLEHHTIFKSKDLHLLTLSVLAARALLSPFKIGASLLPIVPNTSRHLPLLEAPFPYIYGITSTSSMPSISLPHNICIVDLDKGTLDDHMLDVELPGQALFIRTIENFLKQDKQYIVAPPPYIKTKDKKVPNQEFIDFLDRVHFYMRPPRYLRCIKPKYVFIPPLVENLLNTFSHHIANKLEGRISPCFVTDSTDCEHPVTIFNKDLFLASVPKDEEAFYQEFTGTQIFTQFCEGKTDKMDEKKRIFSTFGSTSETNSSSNVP